jgi:gliding motility-associated-like protein
MIPRQQKILSLLFLSLIAASHASMLFCQANQFFVRHGNNISDLNCSGVLFAPLVNKYHQSFGAGSALIRKPVDLTKPFEASFFLDFTDTIAADGGSVIFQSDTSSIGGSYDGLGYRGITKSIAITFDAVKNTTDADPFFDHVSIQTNGDINHSSLNNIAGPVNIEPYYTLSYNPPDPPTKKFYHLITVQWNPASKLLSALIDNNPLIAAQYDIIQKVFNGNSKVYWGFTASNTQTQALPPAAEVDFGYMYFSFGNVIPNYTAQPNLDTCFNNRVQFFDNSLYSSNGNTFNLQLFKWFWDFGDGTTSILQNPLPHNYPSPGSYPFKFTVTNQLGCTTDTLKRIIILGSKPTVDFSVTAACTNSNVLFSDKTKTTTGVATNWLWNFGNGTGSIDQNPVAGYTAAGIVTVSLQVISNLGCKADTSKQIAIEEKPLIDFSFSKDCDGNVNYGFLLLNNVPLKNSKWSFGDNTFSDQLNPSHFFKRNDNYNTALFATSSAGCVSDTVKKIISINKIYAFAGSDTVIAVNQPLQLQASGGDFYSWSPAVGLSNSSIADPVVVITADKTYFLTVRNRDGCEGKDTIRVKVYKGPDIYVPTAFTPDNDGLNDLLRLTAPGIKELKFFRVYNRWGELVFETRTVRKGWDGIFKNLLQPAGVYVWILEAIDYQGNKLRKKGTVALIR